MRRLITIAVCLLLCRGTFDLGALAQEVKADAARKIVSAVPPAYPEIARTIHLEGTVRLQVTVAPNGSVKAVKPLGGHPVLVQAADEAVRKWSWARAKEESSELVDLKFHLQ